MFSPVFHGPLLCRAGIRDLHPSSNPIPLFRLLFLHSKVPYSPSQQPRTPYYPRIWTVLIRYHLPLPCLHRTSLHIIRQPTSAPASASGAVAHHRPRQLCHNDPCRCSGRGRCLYRRWDQSSCIRNYRPAFPWVFLKSGSALTPNKGVRTI